MANRDLKDVQGLSRGVAVLSGKIQIVGAASAANNVVTLVGDTPASVSVNGVASVARSGVGLITLTLSDKWVGLNGLQVSLETAGARTVNVSSADVVSTKQIVFRTLTTTLLAIDTPNASTDSIYFTLFLKNSTVK